MTEGQAIAALIAISLVVAVANAFALIVFLRKLKSIRENLEKKRAEIAERAGARRRT